MSPKVLGLLLHWPREHLGSLKSPDPSLALMLLHLEIKPLSPLCMLWGKEGHLGWGSGSAFFQAQYFTVPAGTTLIGVFNLLPSRLPPFKDLFWPTLVPASLRIFSQKYKKAPVKITQNLPLCVLLYHGSTRICYSFLVPENTQIKSKKSVLFLTDTSRLYKLFSEILFCNQLSWEWDEIASPHETAVLIDLRFSPPWCIP